MQVRVLPQPLISKSKENEMDWRGLSDTEREQYAHYNRNEQLNAVLDHLRLANRGSYGLCPKGISWPRWKAMIRHVKNNRDCYR